MKSDSKKNKGFLAVRFRNTNMLFIVCVLAIMTVVSVLMIYRVADRASKDNVRFYTTESMNILCSYLGREIFLVQNAAGAEEIIEWFSDEENPDKKLAAHHKMMHYAGMLAINGLYFAITDSGNEYSIEIGTPFEHFTPLPEPLDPDTLYDQWFFSAINSPHDFTLNLDVDKITNTRRLWINHKVSNGRAVGVFCSALQFDEVFQNLFGKYDNRNAIGFIIDKNGSIQIDSTESDPSLLQVDADTREERHILDFMPNPVFASAVTKYLENHVGHFDQDEEPEVFTLPGEKFQYFSISAIPGTNWLVVTFFNSRALFGIMNFLPPVIVVIIAFILYALASSVLMQRLVFEPLGQLTLSVSESDHDSNSIYGIERDDEIGALARETQDSWGRLNENTEQLMISVKQQERQTRILQAVNTMATALFSAEDDDAFKKAMPRGMKLMAECMDMDRIYVFHNEMINDSLHYVLKYEWLNELGSQGNSVRIGTVLNYDVDASVWKEVFSKGENVIGSLGNMSGEEKDLMESNGVKSVAVFPVFLHGKFWGFVSFDNCHSEQTLSQGDIDILHSASLIMSSAINRNFQMDAIRKAHEYSSLLLNAAPLSCLLWDYNRKLYDCNKKALEVFQVSTKDEYEEKFPELSPEYQPDGRHSMDTMFQLINSISEDNNQTFEWMHQTLNGEPLPMEVRIFYLPFGDNFFIATFLRDLREQKQMLFEIEQRDMLLQTVNQAASILLDSDITVFEDSLYKSMGMMAKAVDADRAYIWKNSFHNGELCATQLYEWADDSAPKISSELIENVSYSSTIPDWFELLSKEQCVNEIARNMLPCTSKFLSETQTLSVFVAPIFVHNDFWGFVGFDDCRRERIFSANESVILSSGCLLIGNAFLRHNMNMELKASAEEAKAASHSKSVFLANMSHEIRTPMNSIVGFSELALDDNISARTTDYLQKILENSEWLLQIINNILDLSKIESGKMELENIPFNLHDLFSACRTLIMPKAIEKGLATHFYAEPSVGKTLYGDPTRLRQVLVNLLYNAVKFTNTGLIKMQASVKNIGTDTVTMLFEIKDSGIGIAADQMKRIFDPFIQAETGTTRKFGGSGLGLPITKNIVEMMGGQLNLESTPGVGSKFSFEITFDAVDSDNAGTVTERIVLNDLKKPAFEGEVLLCEDNSMNQQVICEHLTRIGLKTEIAQNGKIGVEMVKDRVRKGEKQFDLIFMDIHMPVMDGLEAAAKISEFDPAIPIVAITANIMSNDREIYASRGMSDCIGKPFTSQELWRCLMKYFRPVSWQKEDGVTRERADNDLRQSLINNFVKNNRGKYDEIKNAINTGDIKLAYRLVHTLKSNAGQLNKTLLQKAAGEVENNLRDRHNLVTPRQMETLKTELNAVIAALSPLVRESVQPVSSEMPDTDSVREMLEKLEVLLKEGDAECLNFIRQLQMIPESQELIQQINNFDFDPALKTLATLMERVLK